MARDYAKGGYSSKSSQKRKAPTPARKAKGTQNTKQQRPLLLFGGFLSAGILAGLFIAGLVYLSHHKKHNTTAEQNTPTKTASVPQEPEKKPHKTLEAKVNHPHYDFYTILPNRTVDNPSNDEQEVKVPPEEYILQVASVKKFQDADRLRAQLLLLGYEVFINKSTSGNITWHRVNIGPFKTLRDAEQKQDALRKSEINSMLLKRSKIG